jgi:YVTN family beta-propeller protein
VRDNSRGAEGRALPARLAAGAISIGLVATLVSCPLGDDPTRSRTASPPRTETVAGVELYPLTRPVAEACRQVQGQTREPILCPTKLPRPSRALGSSGSIPYSFAVSTIRNSDGVNGIDVSYSAETSRPRLDVPGRFLHFDVQTRTAHDVLPAGVRPATLGGKRGLLAPASSRSYATEPYFANHVRFFWREGKTRYAATLHNFGPRTRAVLSALIELLRPADKARARRLPLEPGVEPIPVPIYEPTSVAIEGEAVWVAGTGLLGNVRLAGVDPSADLVRLDCASGALAGEPTEISRYLGPMSLATNGGLWIAQSGIRQPDLLRLDQDGEGFGEFFTAGTDLVGLVLTDDAIWALDMGEWTGFDETDGGTVERLDRETGRTVARIRVGRAPSAIAVGEGSVWVTNNLDDTVSRIDLQSNRRLATIPVSSEPVGIATGFGAIWVANTGSDTVSRIDPDRGKVTGTIEVGRGPRGMAVGEGGVWVTNYLDDTVSRINPDTGRVSETIPVGAGPTGIAVSGGGTIWVADTLDRSVSRIDP